jgi:Rrf2 family protein
MQIENKGGIYYDSGNRYLSGNDYRRPWMFRINKKTDYAVRVMVCLARQPAGSRLPTQRVQDEMLIPRPFLRRIIADLSRAGLVNTYPGPGGGLELALPVGQVNLRHIWEASEGPLLISECLKSFEECPLTPECLVRGRWARMQASLLHELQATTLADLVQEAQGPLALASVSQFSDVHLPIDG